MTSSTRSIIRKIKRLADQTGIEPYLGPVYRLIVKRPYWWLRRDILSIPITRTFGDVTAKFVVEGPADLQYHEVESERAVIEDVIENADNTDVFYDIGANVGLFTCAVGQVVDYTVAFEPSPIAYEKLLKNVSYNNLNAETHRTALSDKTESADLAVDSDDPHSRETTLIPESKPEMQSNVVKVQTERLESFVGDRSLPTPTIAKIDVEGAEYRVLCGMGEVLDSIHTLYCEVHGNELESASHTRADLITLLEEQGFTVTALEKMPGETEYIKASR